MTRKVDGNQAIIVAALRAAGASVQTLHEVGSGCPDLAVGHHGQTFLIEVKEPRSANRPTKAEREWFESWRGHAAVVTTPEQALRIIGVT